MVSSGWSVLSAQFTVREKIKAQPRAAVPHAHAGNGRDSNGLVIAPPINKRSCVPTARGEGKGCRRSALKRAVYYRFDPTGRKYPPGSKFRATI